MIVLIDNYDSFAFNLVHYLGALGADVVVHRNNKISTADVIAAVPDAICSRLARARLTRPASASTDRQGRGGYSHFWGFALATVDWPSVRRRCCACPGAGALANCPRSASSQWHLSRDQRTVSTPRAIHSLVVDQKTIPQDLTVTAETEDALVMGLQHKTLPVHGVQFHPESIASEHGHVILKNFLDLAAHWNAAKGRRPARRQRGAARPGH